MKFYPVMRFRIIAITIALLSLSSYKMTAQHVFTQLKEVFLTEGIRVDCYVLAEEMSRLLKPSEPAQPQRIKQLEERLQSAYISELRPLPRNWFLFRRIMSPILWKTLLHQMLRSSIWLIATHGFYKDNCDASEMKCYKDIMATDRGREYSPVRRYRVVLLWCR